MPPSPYRHPRRSLAAPLIEWVANAPRFARWRRRVLSRLPFLPLRSDVVDIVYLTWLVPVAHVRSHVPDGVDLWQRDGLTPFTILTYRHRHFGPALLGPLRKLFASPLQSNWRLYLREAPAGAPGGRTVLFTHNALSNLLYVLGARSMSDALPADLPARFVHQKTDDGTYTTDIAPGVGSAPALSACVRRSRSTDLPPAFARLFAGWREAVAFLALQDAAVVSVPGTPRLAHAEIDLPIPMDEVLCAQGVQVDCPLVDAWHPVGPPLCFVVPRVSFRVWSERLLPTGATH
ncbi:DUF2071 domain-containing protein [Ideonella sp. B7]|nr:DUF2071 domain-containing protein [Ideonella benzenivorans]